METFKHITFGVHADATQANIISSAVYSAYLDAAEFGRDTQSGDWLAEQTNHMATKAGWDMQVLSINIGRLPAIFRWEIVWKDQKKLARFNIYTFDGRGDPDFQIQLEVWLDNETSAAPWGLGGIETLSIQHWG